MPTSSLPNLRQFWIISTIFTAMIGFQTACVAVTTIVLLRKGIKRISTALLLLSIMSMFAATCVFWAEILHLALRALDVTTEDESILFDNDGGACVGTASLAINITLGDSIVWWRALAVWPGVRWIRVMCAVLILATGVLGILDILQTCLPGKHTAGSSYGSLGSGSGSFFQGSGYGATTSAVSVTANVVATALIAYKAWTHRRLIRKHLQLRGFKSQAERVLALLVESGIVYCAIGIFVLSTQLATFSDKYYYYLNFFRMDSALLRFFQYFVNSALVSVIAIYPMFIIIVVALDRSHCDSGFTYHDDAPEFRDRPAAAGRESTLVFQPRVSIDVQGANIDTLAASSTTIKDGREETMNSNM